MSDLNLLLFGMTISFITASGAYVFMRHQFNQTTSTERPPLRDPVVPILTVSAARPISK